ncbi:hypothetical protein [Yoonia sp. BS5-3]|uniref:Uncharacterized protein n=1 Tax=Yoonia phaeophyticola TaxID=3137369 RepID=A0ABZ2V0X4_9RHOB
MFDKVSGTICSIMFSVFAIVSPSIVSANIGVPILETQGATIAADHVQLIAHDGSATVTGRFLGYEDHVYQIETELGVLRIAEKWVRCEGMMCPQIEALNASPEKIKVN